MPRHHFIPAAVIGLFSLEDTGIRRQRRVACARRGVRAPWIDRAKNLLWADTLYDIPGDAWAAEDERNSDNLVDDVWSAFEPRLPRAIEQLAQRQELDASTWLGTLVPFVASIFVRGQEFAQRYEGRFGQEFAGRFETLLSEGNTNMSRLLEFQRLLAPVCAARWLVLHAPDGTNHILNDLGVSPVRSTEDDGTTTYGWVIPVTRQTLIGILPRPRRTVLSAEGRHLDGGS